MEAAAVTQLTIDLRTCMVVQRSCQGLAKHQIDLEGTSLEVTLRSLDSFWESSSRGDAPNLRPAPGTVRAVRRAGSERAAAILLVGIGLATACSSGSPAGVGRLAESATTTSTSIAVTPGSTPESTTPTPASTSTTSTTTPDRANPATSAPIEAVEPTLGAGDALYPELGSSDIDVVAYDVALTYDPATDQLTGEVSIDVELLVDTDTVPLDAAELVILDVSADGVPALWTTQDDELLIELAEPRRRGSHVTVNVAYEAPERLRSMEAGFPVGWYDTEGGSYALNEPDGASAWLPTSDHPSDKATWRFEITVPEGTSAVANGDLVDEIHSGDEVTWVWEERQQMTTYAVLLLTGDYQVVDGEVVDGEAAAGVDLVHAVLPTSRAVLDVYEPVTVDQLEIFEQWFGKLSNTGYDPRLVTASL
jgi:hypothetical protein